MDCTDSQPCLVVVMEMNLVIQEVLGKQTQIDSLFADMLGWLLIKRGFAVVAFPILELAISFTNFATLWLG